MKSLTGNYKQSRSNWKCFDEKLRKHLVSFNLHYMKLKVRLLDIEMKWQIYHVHLMSNFFGENAALLLILLLLVKKNCQFIKQKT